MSKVKVTFRGSNLTESFPGRLGVSEDYPNYVAVIDEEDNVTALINPIDVLLVEVVK